MIIQFNKYFPEKKSGTFKTFGTCVPKRWGSNFVVVILNNVKTRNDNGQNTGSYECIPNLEDGVKEFYLLDGVRDDGRNTFRTI